MVPLALVAAGIMQLAQISLKAHISMMRVAGQPRKALCYVFGGSTKHGHQNGVILSDKQQPPGFSFSAYYTLPLGNNDWSFVKCDSIPGINYNRHITNNTPDLVESFQMAGAKVFKMMTAEESPAGSGTVDSGKRRLH